MSTTLPGIWTASCGLSFSDWAGKLQHETLRVQHIAPEGAAGCVFDDAAERQLASRSRRALVSWLSRNREMLHLLHAPELQLTSQEDTTRPLQDAGAAVRARLLLRYLKNATGRQPVGADACLGARLI